MDAERRVDCSDMATAITRIAVIAQQRLPSGSVAWAEAVRRTKMPIDYMRCAELPAVLAQIALAPGWQILDVSSPQWFSLYLAHSHPQVKFTYVNISEAE